MRSVVGEFPESFPKPAVIDFTSATDLFVDALLIGLIGFMESVSGKSNIYQKKIIKKNHFYSKKNQHKKTISLFIIVL